MKNKDLTYERLQEALGNLPEFKLVEECRQAIEEMYREAGEIMVRGIILSSVEGLAGPKSQGRAKGEGKCVRHGKRQGSVFLGPVKVKVERPRVRTCAGEGGEARIPAWETLRSDEAACGRIHKALISGLSTRKFASAMDLALDAAGVSKSTVSRRFVKQAEKELDKLTTRPIPSDILAVFVDGMAAGGSLVTAVGIDSKGKKHALGVVDGTTENSAVAGDLFRNLIERGLDVGQRILFILDGAKALEKAVKEICGHQHPIQRCRVHKKRNVLDRLPRAKRAYVKSAMNSAWKLPPDQGIPQMRRLAEELRVSHPDAANSLLEGLAETFTVNTLDLSPLLRVSLATTNLIENPHGAIRNAIRRIGRFRKGQDAKRWAASVLLEAEKSFRNLKGSKDLWMLEAALGRLTGQAAV